MKDGTGGDPFADDPIESTEEPADTDETRTADPMTETTTRNQTATNEDTTRELPYIYRRETVKEGRDQVPFFLKKDSRDLEEEFIENLEERLDMNVYKADAREAALKVVMQNHVAEVADRLREWGYDR